MRAPREVPSLPHDPRPPASDFTYIDYIGAIGNDIAALFSIVWRQRVVAVAAFEICLLAGVWYAITAEPVYRAETVITPRAPDASSNLSGLLSSRLGSLSPLVGARSDQTTRELVVALTARNLLYPFIEKHQVKRAFFPDLWDERTGQWRLVTASGIRGTLSRFIRELNGRPEPPPQYGPTDEDAADTLLRHMRVSQDVTSNLIRLSIDWYNSPVAAEWANGLVSMLNEARRQTAITRSNARISLLQQQLLTNNSIEMRTALTGLIQSEAETIVIANSEPQFALQVIDPAVSSQNAVWPRRGLIVLISAIFGLIVGTTAALGANAWVGNKRPSKRRKKILAAAP